MTNFQSLDGVIHTVLSADEDREGGFEYGGWVLPYTDEVVAGFMQEAAAAAMNRVPKHVASRTLAGGDWDNRVILGADVGAEVAALKELPGNDLGVFGSGELLPDHLGAYGRVGVALLTLQGAPPLPVRGVWPRQGRSRRSAQCGLSRPVRATAGRRAASC